MLPPDLALALLINRTGQAYTASAPAYIAYTERTHITATIGRSQDINRSVVVRNADNFAVMKDLPDGGERTGQAFPIVPYFDPLGQFGFSYFANLKLVTITLDRELPWNWPMPYADPNVGVVIPYFSYFAPAYAPDSTESAPHFTIDPTSRLPGNTFYPSDVVEDPVSHLPSRIEMREGGSDMIIALDYKVLEGHWTIVHGMFTSTQHVLMLGTFKVVADVHYDDITFPAAPSDPRLLGTPTPKP
jgi:hypothetical protein